ncbi:MAG: CPBP family intramembrane glutamic endopeptidase [Caulobacterales bacterium]
MNRGAGPDIARKRWPGIVALPLAVVIALLVSASGALAWSALIGLNLHYRPDLPWSAPAMLGVMALVWAYFAGLGPPVGFRKARKSLSRINWPTPSVWRLAAPASALTAASILAVWFAALRLGHFSPADFHAPSMIVGRDLSLVLCGLVMTAAVAGFFEELAYRGILQTTIQRRLGPTVAVLLSAVLFYAVHLRYGWASGDASKAAASGISILWAGIALGVLTYCAGSIWPAVFAHTLTDLASLSAEWKLGWTYDVSPVPSGGDPQLFLVSAIAAASLVSLAVLFPRLAARGTQ